MTTSVYVFVVSLELDDADPKQLCRTEYPVVDEEVARALAAAKLDAYARDYPRERLIVGFRRVR